MREREKERDDSFELKLIDRIAIEIQEVRRLKIYGDLWKFIARRVYVALRELLEKTLVPVYYFLVDRSDS